MSAAAAPAAPTATPDRKTIRRVVGASVIGNTIETYDLFIYGTAAALVFPTVFFSNLDGTAAVLFSFLTFGASFLARPLGAIILGHFGDRIGRKKLLVFSLLLMGIATFAIALLPGYDAWGPAAPIILVLLRICQGFGYGGEWSGAITMVSEYAPANKRSLFTSFPQVGTPLGLIAANLIFIIMSAVLPNDQFLSWGWRVPFLLSIVLVGVGFYLRRRVDETPQFKELEKKGDKSKAPLLDVLRHPSGLLLVTGSTIAAFGIYYVVTTYLLSYVTGTEGIDRSIALTCLLVAAAVQGLGVLGWGWLSGKVNPTKLLLVSVIFMGLWAFPLVWLTATAVPLLIGVAFVGFMAIQSMFYGPMGGVFHGLFDTRYRYTGLGMGLNLGGLLGGGIAPLIAVTIPFGPGIAVMVIVMAVISLLFVIGIMVRWRALHPSGHADTTVEATTRG
ncbi:MHS family MFS transporter [Herbiconiux sp. CPCC 203407]|uniref:Putative proline/betaine transporter n=1 Tax=Herbiconiux oxytropis TaxID=2970915 RepID=A0AA41XIQ1_9MICO|nr:MFS transporter [Herbiconiux oxytropis]MCS5721695.1 MHS family MFS transporter [Herbiconiux oxytropis]MCS5726678.1 MHS family MFS transporter [Herbiconiux oxytropis]